MKNRITTAKKQHTVVAAIGRQKKLPADIRSWKGCSLAKALNADGNKMANCGDIHEYAVIDR